MKNLDRRKFIKRTSMSAAAVALVPNEFAAMPSRPFQSIYMGDHAAPKLETIRAAFIGVGARGGTHLKFFAALEGTEVVAICDLYEDLVKQKVSWVREVAVLSMRQPTS